MNVKPEKEVVQPSPKKAKVVFMRDSMVGSAIQASLFDVSSAEPEFIGIISNGTKIQYDVSPGNRIFMVVSESADFMRANLRGGKTYYALVTPRMGVWKARFSFQPVRPGGEGDLAMSSSELESWMNDTDLVVNTKSSRKWARNNMPDVKQKYDEYWPVWKNKPKEERDQQTLFAGDGR